jgi:phage N-6-adenine-methyltransferase
MKMLFDVEQYKQPKKQSYTGDWNGVRYDPTWDEPDDIPELKNEVSTTVEVLQEKEEIPHHTSLNCSRVVRKKKSSDCWYTPPYILELVVQVLREIDLDPCADDGKHISCKRHYTKEDDGLIREWEGRVFMNPPYSQPGVWMEKLQAEIKLERVTEAIALVPAATDTQWLSPVLKSQPVCFWTGRIKFLSEDYQPRNSARQSHVLVYWGLRKERFREVFEPHGVVYLPASLHANSNAAIHDAVLPVEGTSSTNMKTDMETVLPVGRTSSTCLRNDFHPVLPVKRTSSTNIETDMEIVLSVGQTSSTHLKKDSHLVLPVEGTSSTNLKTDMEIVLPVGRTSSTFLGNDLHPVLPVKRTSSTNIETDMEMVLPAGRTSSTKRRSYGEGTGRIHWRTFTKKNGKQYQQPWYDWQFKSGKKTVFKSTYIPKQVLPQVQQLEAHKAPIKKILKVLGVMKLQTI